MTHPPSAWSSNRTVAGTLSARPRQFRSDGSYNGSGAHPPIRVYHSIGSRFVIGDLFAKLQAYAEKNESER